MDGDDRQRPRDADVWVRDIKETPAQVLAARLLRAGVPPWRHDSDEIDESIRRVRVDQAVANAKRQVDARK